MLGENPKMNMMNFPRDVWILHRKLFHRFLKHFQCFKNATEQLEDFCDSDSDDGSVASSYSKKKTGQFKKKDGGFVISLLSSDSEDADDDDDTMG